MCVDRASTTGVLRSQDSRSGVNTLPLRSTPFPHRHARCHREALERLLQARLPGITSSLISSFPLALGEPHLSMAIGSDLHAKLPLRAVARTEPGAAAESTAGLPIQFRHRQLGCFRSPLLYSLSLSLLGNSATVSWQMLSCSSVCLLTVTDVPGSETGGTRSRQASLYLQRSL